MYIDLQGPDGVCCEYDGNCACGDNIKKLYQCPSCSRVLDLAHDDWSAIVCLYCTGKVNKEDFLVRIWERKEVHNG